MELQPFVPIELTDEQKAFLKVFRDALRHRVKLNHPMAVAFRYAPTILSLIMITSVGLSIAIRAIPTIGLFLGISSNAAFVPATFALISLVVGWGAAHDGLTPEEGLPFAFREFQDSADGKICQDSRLNDIFGIINKIRKWNKAVPGRNTILAKVDVGTYTPAAVEKAYPDWQREEEEVRRGLKLMDALIALGKPGEVKGELDTDKLLEAYLPTEQDASFGALSLSELEFGEEPVPSGTDAALHKEAPKDPAEQVPSAAAAAQNRTTAK